jgi:hypothetical protein
MANFVYRKWRLRLANSSTPDWDAPGDVRAILVMTNTTADTETTADFVADFTTLDECDATGYARVALTTEAIVEDVGNDRIELSAAAISFGSPSADATRQVQAVILYEHVTNDADSYVIAYYDTVSSGPAFPFTVNGGSITITPNAEGLIQIS